MTKVVWRSHVNATPESLFEFHMNSDNLAAISPPWPPFRVVSEPKRAEPGDVQVFRLGAGPFATTWEARITRVVPGRLLEDVQDSGPFQSWRHQHQFLPEGDGAILADVVAFRLLPTVFGEFLEYLFVRPAILGMFAFRHWRTKRLLAAG